MSELNFIFKMKKHRSIVNKEFVCEDVIVVKWVKITTIQFQKSISEEDNTVYSLVES